MSQQINLFNPIFRRRELLLSGRNLIPAVVIALVLSLLYWQWIAQGNRALQAVKESNVKALESSQQRFLAMSQQMDPALRAKRLEQEIKEAEEKLALTRSVLEQLEGGSLGNTSGYSENMRAFARQIGDGIWLTGFALAGRGAAIRGGALRPELLPAYVKRLSQEKGFRGQEFAALDMQEPRRKEEPGEAQTKKAVKPGYLLFELSSRPIERKDANATSASLAATGGPDHLSAFTRTLGEVNQHNKISDAKALVDSKLEGVKSPDAKIPAAPSAGAAK